MSKAPSGSRLAADTDLAAQLAELRLGKTRPTVQRPPSVVSDDDDDDDEEHDQPRARRDTITQQSRPESRVAQVAEEEAREPNLDVPPEYVVGVDVFSDLFKAVQHGAAFHGIDEKIAEFLSESLRYTSMDATYKVYQALNPRLKRIVQASNEDLGIIDGWTEGIERRFAATEAAQHSTDKTLLDISSKYPDQMDKMEKSIKAFEDEFIPVIKSVQKNQRDLASLLVDAEAKYMDLRTRFSMAWQENQDIRKRLDTLEKQMTQLSPQASSVPQPAFTMPTTFAAQAPVAPQVYAQTQAYTAAPQMPTPFPVQKPKIADPQKFKGTSELTLESWFSKVGAYCTYYDKFTDDERIMTHLFYLEGGPQEFMNDYFEKVANRQPLGSFADFKDYLSKGYRQLAPEKSAQKDLEAWCSKKHSNIVTFGEKFRLYASRSGYSDKDLIARIEEKISHNVKMCIVQNKMSGNSTVPTNWVQFLDYVIEIDMWFRGDKTSKSESKNSTAMDVDTMQPGKPLDKQQLEWFAKGSCLRCGKHKYEKGKQCRAALPEYKGRFQLPDRADKGKQKQTQSTSARIVDESSRPPTPTVNADNAESVRRLLADHDQKKKQEKKEKTADTSEHSHFLQETM